MIFFNLHTHQAKKLSNTIALVNQYPQNLDALQTIFSIGIHPLYINLSRLDEDLQQVTQQLSHPNCYAVGECGLDKRSETAMELQVQIFEKQLQLAQNAQKPVVIHCVQAHNQLVQIVQQQKITIPLLFHGFSKNLNIAKQLLANNFYLSFGASLFANASNAMVFKEVPKHRFFLETDAAEFSIEEIYEKAAKIKEISIEEIESAIQYNFENVFRKKMIDLVNTK